LQCDFFVRGHIGRMDGDGIVRQPLRKLTRDCFRNCGGGRSGRFVVGRGALAVPAYEGNLRFFILARWAEVFGGATMQGAPGNRYFDSQAIASIGAIAVGAFESTDHLRGGRGEADIALGHFLRNGMYRSSDGGKTWARIGLEDSRQIARILVDPRDPEKVLWRGWDMRTGRMRSAAFFYSKDGGKEMEAGFVS